MQTVDRGSASAAAFIESLRELLRHCKVHRWLRGAERDAANFRLEGSFSAVPKPTLGRKYALESSRRDLHNALLCTVSNLNFLSNFAN